MITEPGIYPDMDEATYHADPCPHPSLSSSIVRTIIGSTLAHAHLQHPRLGGKDHKATDATDAGTLLHSLVMGRVADPVLVDAPDWKKKAAQTERDEARAAGKVVFLRRQHEALQVAAGHIRRFMSCLPGNPLGPDYANEVTLIWQEPNGVWCKARPDFFPYRASRQAIIYDLKTSEMSAEPKASSRRLSNMGAYIQAALYRRGYRVLFGVEPRFVFVPAEIDPPYACVPIEFSPASLALADRMIDQAVQAWGQALRTAEFPAYPVKIVRVDIPPWVENEWIEREQKDLDEAERPIRQLEDMEI